ncbi:MAG: family N-acetyltransferase [Bacteroidetes bacterium]|nr:family N-acetyltransferase [Bacteroidota bacterium]
MDIGIRDVEEKDFTQIVALFHEFAAFEKLPDKMTNSVEKMHNEKEFFHCFVAATADNRIVGYVTFFFGYYTWIGKSLYMDDLYVKPEYRAAGIGTMLINRVIALAKASECHKLRWQVSEWNKPAIAFYKHLGAEIDGTEQNCDLIFD